MRQLIRAALFDLDGVVVFTDKYHYLGWKRLADEQGWAFDEQVNHLCRGIPRLASLQVILDHNRITLPAAEKERLANVKNEYYKELLATITSADVCPGVLGFLDALARRDVPLGLCSSSKNAGAVLDALRLTKYFRTVVTGHDIQRAKPHPEIFLKGAAGLAVAPFFCVVFEDAESGVAAALCAGMHCVGVGTPELLPNAPATITDFSTIDLACLLASARPGF